MRPLTTVTPKAMLVVNRRPFIAAQLDWLTACGFDEVVICLGYLGEQIEHFVGDGSRWGIRARFSHEGDDLRGTAGALRLAFDEGLLEHRFAVVYGDSYLPIDAAEPVAAFDAGDHQALMSVYRNDGRYDTSNVIVHGDLVQRYDKQAAAEGEAGFDYIDYGMMVFARELIPERVPQDTKLDLAGVLKQLSAEGALAAFVVNERFYEIGSPEGLAELDDFLSKKR